MGKSLKGLGAGLALALSFMAVSTPAAQAKTCSVGEMSMSKDCAGAHEGKVVEAMEEGVSVPPVLTEIAEIDAGLSDGSLTIRSFGQSSGIRKISGDDGITAVLVELKSERHTILFDLEASEGVEEGPGPSDTGADPGLSDTPAFAALPLPAAGWMLLAGLCGLGLVARGRRRAA